MQNIQEWLIGDWRSAGALMLSAVLIYIFISVCVRLVGLRSFSKMSSTDFVTTIAIGSVFGSAVLTKNGSVFMSALAMGSLFLIRWSVSFLKRRSQAVASVFDNQPVYLMKGPDVQHAALDAGNVSLDDLHAKLREANVWNYEQVLCVVLETTGDVSVLHRSAPELPLTEDIFGDVTPVSTP